MTAAEHYAHCEHLAQELGRVGAFAEMTYRLFPETRNSFTPNLRELGFDFQEVRLVNRGAELRFQIFPAALVTPLKKQLEDLRNELRHMDEGPLSYTGAPFVTHTNLRTFRAMAARTRTEISNTLRTELVDNYDRVRERAHQELKDTMETLLPRLGIENIDQILADPSWFDGVFPPQTQLTGDFKLWINIYNVHPTALTAQDTLRKQVERIIRRPRQLVLFP
jgi:hypothetical protein